MSSDHDDARPRRPKTFLARVGRGLSFMNKLALVILVLGCLVVAFKHS